MALPVRDQRTSRRPVCFSAKRMANLWRRRRFGASGPSAPRSAGIGVRTEPQVRCPCPAGPSPSARTGAGAIPSPDPPGLLLRDALGSLGRHPAGTVRRQLSRRGRRAAAGRPADRCSAARPATACGAAAARPRPGPDRELDLAARRCGCGAVRLERVLSRRSSSPHSPWRSRPRACCRAGCCGRASPSAGRSSRWPRSICATTCCPTVLTLPLIPAGLAVAYAIDPARLPEHALGAAPASPRSPRSPGPIAGCAGARAWGSATPSCWPRPAPGSAGRRCRAWW